MKLISNMVEAHIFRMNKNKMEFLLLKRAESEIYPGLWQMVSGKMKKNEKAYNTALREIKEETGLKPSKLWTVPNVNSFYSPEKNSISFLPVFVVEVNNNDSVTLSEEHSDYKWVSSIQAKKLLAWQGQRKSVDIISEYFLAQKSFLKFVEIKIK